MRDAPSAVKLTSMQGTLGTQAGRGPGEDQARGRASGRARGTAMLRCARFGMCLMVAAGTMGVGAIGGQFDHVMRKFGIGPAAGGAVSVVERHAARSGFVPYSTGSSQYGRRMVRVEAQGDTPRVGCRVEIPKAGSVEHVYLQYCALVDGGFAASEGFARNEATKDSVDVEMMK